MTGIDFKCDKQRKVTINGKLIEMILFNYKTNISSNKSEIIILLLTEKVKPIFHKKTGLRWVPDANEIYTKNMKCTCPTRKFCVGTQCNLYSTGFASGKNAKNWHHPTPEIPTCWYLWCWVTQNSGVGCIAQRQPPMPGILRSGGI